MIRVSTWWLSGGVPVSAAAPQLLLLLLLPEIVIYVVNIKLRTINQYYLSQVILISSIRSSAASVSLSKQQKQRRLEDVDPQEEDSQISRMDSIVSLSSEYIPKSTTTSMDLCHSFDGIGISLLCCCPVSLSGRSQRMWSCSLLCSKFNVFKAWKIDFGLLARLTGHISFRATFVSVTHAPAGWLAAPSSCSSPSPAAVHSAQSLDMQICNLLQSSSCAIRVVRLITYTAISPSKVIVHCAAAAAGQQE